MGDAMLRGAEARRTQVAGATFRDKEKPRVDDVSRNILAAGG